MPKHKVRCTGCDKNLQFEDRHIGRKVKCPNCGAAVMLAVAAEVTKPRDEIDDPFLEDAAPPPVRKKKVPGGKQASRSGVSKSPAPVPKNSSRNSVPEPEQEPVDAPKESSPDDLAADWLADESYRDRSSGEPYIDELGLGELDVLRTDDWSVPGELPPAKRSTVKKKSTSSIAAIGESAVSEKRKPARGFSDELDSESPSSRRWLIYCLFFATLIPLGINVLIAADDDLDTRINQSLEQADENGEFPDMAIEEGVPISRDDLIDALPDGRVQGAFLGRDTWVHWMFAGVSGVGFTTLFLSLFHRYRNALGGAVVGAIFTATVGIILLIGLQWAAFASQGVWIRGRGIIVLLFYLVKFIGFSYQCALEEGNGFMSSFMGFTLGVGICEELCKILPVIVYLGTAKNSTWQGACLVGLASGVGFGVAEGIMYSASYYNGISGGEIYVVRFVSCVALHAVWTGAGSVLLFCDQDFVHGGADWNDILVTLAKTLGVSIILHGLYDTLLKQDFEVGALIVGILSVGWLIGVVEKLTRFQPA